MRIANTQGIKNIATNGGSKAANKGNLPKEGEIIEGKIINSNREMVEVLLNNGQKLRASLRGSRFFNIGDNVKFIVKSSDLSQLILKGVSDNSIEDKLIKVLENAGERPNERNISIVKNLFDEGMPVNKENVSKFVKLGLRFKGLTPKMLTSFAKLDIPFTKANADFVSKLISGDKPLFNDVESLAKALLADTEGADEAKQALQANQGQELPKEAEKELVQLKSELKSGEEVLKNLSEEEVLTKLVKIFSDEGEKDGFKPLDTKLSKLFKAEDMASILDKLVDKEDGGKSKLVLKQAIKEAFTKGESLENLAKTLIGKGIKKEKVFKALKEVFVNNKIVDKLYVKPEDFSKPEVKETAKNTVKIASSLGAEEISEDVKAKAAKLTESVKILDKLSQEYNFIHVPISVNQREGNAEVYVKKNKGKSAGKDSLKALLRLDFANMGHLDILVGKEAKNISLTFYSEDGLEDVKENIKLLRKEFSKAGFSLVECDFKNEVGARNMQAFFSNDEEEENKPKVTFDMRA